MIDTDSNLQAVVDKIMVVDWQRLRVQVLEPLLAKQAASWHPLDFMPEIF